MIQRVKFKKLCWLQNPVSILKSRFCKTQADLIEAVRIIVI